MPMTSTPTSTTQLLAQWQPCINFAFVNNFNTPNWLFDSGASHHVTFDLSDISIHTPYDNSNDIVISDGTSFRTTHSSSTSLFTLSHIFYLNNVPCVPTMKNNIILSLNSINLIMHQLRSQLLLFMWRIYAWGNHFARSN